MFHRFPRRRDEIIDLLRHHTPVPRHTVETQIAIRWVTTIGMIGLLPLAAVMTVAPHRFLAVSGWVVGALAGLGLLAVVIGVLARQKQGLNRQWGLAPLTSHQATELAELSAQDPEVSRIVDEWMDRWIGARAHLIGRDLILLRAAMAALHKAQEPVSASATAASWARSTS